MNTPQRLLWRSTLAHSYNPGVHRQACPSPLSLSARNPASVRWTSSKVQDGATKPKARGSYTRVFLAFSIGIPLGFAIHLFNQRSNNSRRSSSADFVRYTLVDKEHISSTSSIFSLFPSSTSAIDTFDPALVRGITSVQFKQPQLQIARWYTILPRAPDQEKHELRFLIRKEENGEVSGYLHRLPVDAGIELRGPNVDYLLPEDVSTVVFLAGGTGIAPALQVADTLTGKATMHLLWANRHREDCVGGFSDSKPDDGNSGWFFSKLWPLSLSQNNNLTKPASVDNGPIVAYLERLKSNSHTSATDLLVDYFVDEEGTFIQPKKVSQIVGDANSIPAENKTKIIFVSGPEGFVKYWAGPKQWANGRETQGPLGGALALMDLQGWKVVKL